MDATGGLALEIGRLVRQARLTIGWTQHQLGGRARVAQTTISRLERGVHCGIDFDDLERIAKAMGGRLRVQLHAPFLEERGRQRDRVHAVCIGYVTRRLRGQGWVVMSEVEIAGSAGPGWIDVLGWHPGAKALVVIEIKTEIHDFGRIQRTLGWYLHGAAGAAKRLGWQPRSIRGVLLLLDSADVAAGLRANRELAGHAFPGRAVELAAWIADPAGRTLSGSAVATIDPRSRRKAWLRPATIDGRRSPPAYAGYADVARQLTV